MLRKVCVFALAAVVLLLAGCEKSILSDEEGSNESDGIEGNVVLRLSVYQQEDFGTRSVTDIGQLCSRVNVAFFQGGTKVKTVSQQSSGSSFGTVPVTLEAGTYQVVVIGHNCSGSATISNEEQVTFPSNLVTDTFYYYGDLTVSGDKDTYDIVLKRCVAMFRLTVTDEFPADAAKIRFYYTGGSSTFSPMKGYGCVNSRQTDMQTIGEGQKVFECYTLPHAETGELKITITVYDSNTNILSERVLENVPVTRNKITSYSGSLFSGTTEPTTDPGNNSQGGLQLSIADSEWTGTDSYSF